MDANLRSLNRLFGGSVTQKEPLFYSKLALLELCGWIEESMDDIVMRFAARRLKDAINRLHVKTQVVKPTSGFEYEKHFRAMLIKTMGLENVEKVERKIDPVVLAQLKSTLGTLKLARNAEAHTHIKGVTRAINAPSVTLTHFGSVYAGLVEYDRVIRRHVG